MRSSNTVFHQRLFRTHLSSLLLKGGTFRTGFLIKRPQDGWYQSRDHNSQRTFRFCALACAFARWRRSQVKCHKDANVQCRYCVLTHLSANYRLFSHFVLIRLVIQLRPILCFRVFRRSAYDAHIFHRGRVNLFRRTSYPRHRVFRVSSKDKCCYWFYRDAFWLVVSS